MHLTTQTEKDHTALAASAAGAPEMTDISLTPAMIQAGVKWLEEYYHLAYEGDVRGFWRVLMEARRI